MRATIRGVAAGLIVGVLAAVPAAGAMLHGNGMIAFDRDRTDNWDIYVKQAGQGKPGRAADDKRCRRLRAVLLAGRHPHRLHERPPRQLRHLHDEPRRPRPAPDHDQPGQGRLPQLVAGRPHAGLRQQPHRRLGDLHHERERLGPPGAGDPSRRRRQPAGVVAGRRRGSRSTRPATATTRSASSRLAGGTVTVLTSGTARNVQPAWSPDGSKIAFASNRSGSFDIWTIDRRVRGRSTG